MQTEFSNILCVVDISIAKMMDQCLEDLALPEVFVQNAKQMSLVDRQGFLGLRSGTRLDERRALIYRLYIPSVYEEGMMRRIAEATDLKMGGRGCLLAQHVEFRRGTPLSFDTEKLDRFCGRAEKLHHEEHALISCIVPRGMGDSLARAMLELGICVPVIFFGTGVGLRDKLGLLRITIPVEKEIIWFVVPRSDAELVEKTIIPRARLDVPGQGFIYKSYVHAPVVNLRSRHGKRTHAATMEQVIAALDEVHGSSEWRRVEAHRHKSGHESKTVNTYGLFFIGEEEEVELFRRTAMDCGAHGATHNHLEMRNYTSVSREQAMESHSRELCDIIISHDVAERLKGPLEATGLFDSKRTCVLKTFSVEMPSGVYHPE